MATLRRTQFVTISTTKAKHEDEVHVNDIFQLLMAFFFSLKMRNISLRKMVRIWPTFLSSLQKHNVAIQDFHKGELSLWDALSEMQSNGLIDAHLPNRTFTLLLTDQKVKDIRECANPKVRNAVQICAIRIVNTYRNIPG